MAGEVCSVTIDLSLVEALGRPLATRATAKIDCCSWGQLSFGPFDVYHGVQLRFLLWTVRALVAPGRMRKPCIPFKSNRSAARRVAVKEVPMTKGVPVF